ncbi:hypothetical protein GQX74_009970 [Glossina fuscipes]|nr:hypothetical protein GQX74_009970 [Glossina fuscipes]
MFQVLLKFLNLRILNDIRGDFALRGTLETTGVDALLDPCLLKNIFDGCVPSSFCLANFNLRLSAGVIFTQYCNRCVSRVRRKANFLWQYSHWFGGGKLERRGLVPVDFIVITLYCWRGAAPLLVIRVIFFAGLFNVLKPIDVKRCVKPSLPNSDWIKIGSTLSSIQAVASNSFIIIH